MFAPPAARPSLQAMRAFFFEQMSDATHWRLLRFRQNSCLLTRHRSARSSSGIIGVLVTLVLTGTTVNVMSLMGVVMLAGIAMSNSILIVEFAHHRRSEGKSVAEAIIESCQVRRRPILMTSLATILGLLPMALKFGEDSESYALLARALAGGLLVSVALTVFLFPAGFGVRSKERRWRRILADMGLLVDAPAPPRHNQTASRQCRSAAWIRSSTSLC